MINLIPAKRLTTLALAGAAWSFLASPAHAIFFDGNGHYSLLGQTRTSPGFDSGSGLHQAVDQNFLLNWELRANDSLSMWLRLELFQDPSEAYLGDTAEPQDCSERDEGLSQANNEPVYKNRGSIRNCAGRHQATGEPRYRNYQPQISQAFVRYAFDYCLLDVGRRPRSWGLGIFLDGGGRLFDTDASVFDGATCHINIQKSQTLALSFGLDKLAETGVSVIPGTQEGGPFGAAKPSDDIDQYFFTIEYDDRRVNAGSALTQQVGIYFANIISSGDEQRDIRRSDIKFADLYLSFFLRNLVIKNELLFRLGRSSDPSWARLGGQMNKEGEPTSNRLQSIASAGSLDFIVSKSGNVIGPPEYNQGDLTQHVVFFDYAHAPGDRDGYIGYGDDDAPLNRNGAVSAVAFHKNYKPALILFNGRQENANLRVDGIFDPERVLNATLFGLGYRYESQVNGTFESKFIFAQLDQVMPEAVKESLNLASELPVGFAGKTIGYELDLKYHKLFGKNVDVGAAAGVLIPGAGLKHFADRSAPTSYVLQSFAAFKF